MAGAGKESGQPLGQVSIGLEYLVVGYREGLGWYMAVPLPPAVVVVVDDEHPLRADFPDASQGGPAAGGPDQDKVSLRHGVLSGRGAP